MSNFLSKLLGSWWGHMILALIASVLAAYYFTDGRVFSSARVFVFATLWSATIWLTQWFGNGYLTNFLDKKVSWIEKPLLRLILGIVVLSTYSSLAILVVCGAFEIMINGGIDDLSNWAIQTIVLAVKISLLIAGILTAVGFFKNWKNKETEAERLKAEMMTYKYESLRSQINPHFLFNSFNVLSELVYENPDLAVQFIAKLSNVYRYVLDSRNVELVPLQEELDFAKTFVFLMEIRFGNSLEVNFNLEAKKDEYVVPMSFQLLIENAVKHNEIGKNKPLIVNVSRSGEMLEIRNRIRLKSSAEESKGIGLENIQSRYAYFTDIPVEIIQDEEFIVRIPVLTKSR